jgi:wyosine [tRNA(Phe)-imidazoG37] synthetase (radical SAM superfamily)
MPREPFKYVFGPVPSRRLGKSLGIDLIPFKTCCLNCLYCECGKTTVHTLERKEYVPARAIIQEIDDFLSGAPSPDVITFAGSGEPTLNTALPELLRHIQDRYPQYKTALLTNGSLLYLEELRQSSLAFDFVLPSIDAVRQETFEKINQPAGGLSNRKAIDGLIAFSKIYSGILWVEVFIIPGINDDEVELALLKETLEKVSLDRVHLNTLDRPPAFAGVQSASPERLRQIARFLAPLPVEIISRKAKAGPRISISRRDIDYFLATLRRRPMTVEDLSVTLGKNINEMYVLLDTLYNKKLITTQIVNNRTFYQAL